LVLRYFELVETMNLGYNTGVVNRKVGRSDAENILRPEQVLIGELTMSHSTPQPSALKVCSKCGQSKPLSEYYQYKSGRNEGQYWPFCRECDHARNRAYRAANDENVRERRRQYNEAHREERRARDRQYIADPEIRRQRAQATRQWRQGKRVASTQDASASEKLARYAVYNAIRRGELPPAWSVVCEHCQEAQGQQYHHYCGYEPEHWLNVVALCTDCHGKAHWVS
jgi:hypothetical protein